MRTGVYIVGLMSLLAVGCSSAPTGKSTPAATPAATAPAATAAPPAQAGAKGTTATAAAAQAAKPAAAATAEAHPGLSCVRGKETRTLKMELSVPKGCKLWYSTHSDKEPVASSSMGPNHCETVRDRIKGNLESAGFKCGEETVTPSKAATAATTTAAAKPMADSGTGSQSQTKK